MELLSQLPKRTRKSLTDQGIWSLIEIVADNLDQEPLQYSDVELQKTVKDLNAATRLMNRQPLFTIFKRGGEA